MKKPDNIIMLSGYLVSSVCLFLAVLQPFFSTFMCYRISGFSDRGRLKPADDGI